MKTTNKIIVAVLIIAVLLVSIGYAAIQNITLNISGTVTGTADDANFKVKFLETTEVSDSSKVTATYTVQNVSTDLSANLSVNTTNNNEEYFAIEPNLGKTSLVAGEVTTLTVTVEVIKTPITTDEIASIGIGLVAEPVQPGEEGGFGSGTGGEITGPTQIATLASVTNDNIGDYIDLGNNIVGTKATTEDWRILYPVENGVIAILADYLPNSTGYAANAGLDTTNKYTVYSNAGSDTLLNRLTTTTYWNGLANEISGATVTGGPTLELLMKSYNAKNGTSLEYESTPNMCVDGIFVSKSVDDDILGGYWVATLYPLGSLPYTNLMGVTAKSCRLGQVTGYARYAFTIRPVVCLSSDTNVVKQGKLWTVVK